MVLKREDVKMDDILHSYGQLNDGSQVCYFLRVRSFSKTGIPICQILKKVYGDWTEYKGGDYYLEKSIVRIANNGDEDYNPMYNKRMSLGGRDRKTLTWWGTPLVKYEPTMEYFVTRRLAN